MGSSKNNSLVNNTNMLIPQSLQNLDIPPEYADKPVQEVRGIGLKYAERLKEKGIKTMKDLLDAGRTSKKQIELAKNTGISPELIETWMDEIFLLIRSRSITMSGRNWYDRKRPHTWTLNNSLIDIDGLELKYARRLAIFGIICWGDLLDKGRTPKKREQLAKETGISKKLIEEWVDHINWRLKGELAVQASEIVFRWSLFFSSIVILSIIILSFVSIFFRGIPTNPTIIASHKFEFKSSDLGVIFAFILLPILYLLGKKMDKALSRKG